MKNFIVVMFIVLVFATGLYLGSNSVETNIASIDTLIVHKTVTLRDTLYKTVEKRVVDSIHINTSDTTFIVLDRTQEVVEGLKFKAWVSGVKPRLDSIETYNDIETRYIERVEYLDSKPKRWGIGVQVGMGASSNNGIVNLSPYIGVGLSYNIIQF
ncbi:MAG: hypothetical protein IMY73_02260 [Bacteroidetes bacterium]|nr:hypothetical protein [Bacteroidota bacterium]